MIRRAGLQDIPWIMEAKARAKAESPHYAGYTTKVGEQYKRLVSLILHTDLVFIGVCEDQTGYVVGSIEPTIWFEEYIAAMHLLWVAPEKRGTLRAWRLVQAFEEWAKSRGARQIIAGVSSGVSEHTAERLYEGMGFHPMGRNFCKEL